MIAEASIDAHVDREQLFRSVRDREALCSTALVANAAFPHPLDPRPFRFSRKRVLLAVLRVVTAHRETEDERRQDGVPVRRIGEHHQHEQRHEDELDLGFDHSVAVTCEERSGEAGQNDDQRD